MPKSTAGKLNNIQVLRAFAACVVVVFHTGFAFPGMHPFGSFGVDVFFVISGYIMARILDGKSEFFFRRRLLRIIPPYWLFTILLFLVAQRYPALMGSTRASLSELVRSLLFIPYAKGSNLIQPLLFIGWSLNYEMFFYCALGVALLFTRRHAALLGSALVLVTMLACMPFVAQSTIATFYARDIVLEFILGVLSYLFCRSLSADRLQRLRIPALAVCLLSAVALVAIQGVFPQMVADRVLSLGLLSLLLVTSASMLSQAGWDTKFAPAVLVGDASYILYLLHPYCEYGQDRILAKHLPWLHINTAVGALIAVSLSIAIACLVHLYGERPLVKVLNNRFGGHRRSTEFAAA